MNVNTNKRKVASVIAAVALLFLPAAGGFAAINGIEGPTFNLTARADNLSTADGGSVRFWGYANGTGRAQYPGATLIVQQGVTVTVNLTNNLSVTGGAPPVSIVFPGQEGVTAAGNGSKTQLGLLTREALPGGTVQYQFVARNPGTYLYHSGTNPELQVEMGLVGALIVRPAMGVKFAYNDPATEFDVEYLYLLSEMDGPLHSKVQFQGVNAALTNLANRWPTYWFINGRTAMDTLLGESVSWLPTQPYGSLTLMRPGDRVLIRLAGGGQDQHPFHTHGNHARVIARDARLEQSAPGAGLDLSHQRFTLHSIPGETVDAIFEWTGKDLGWDIYGTEADGRAHTCTDGGDGYDPGTKEYCADHYKPFPVRLPQTQATTIGGFYSGSPFMGASGALPPGEGGLNPWGGFPFMWHSHNEKELTNFNIFPGGLLTMLIIVPPGTPLP